MSEVLWHVGLAVDLEPQSEVRSARHDDRDVDPDLHVAPSRLDAAIAVSGVALADVVAVLGLERVADRVGAAALAGRGAGGVRGVVGHAEREVHLPDRQADEQDQRQHQHELDAGLPALCAPRGHSSATELFSSTTVSFFLRLSGIGSTDGAWTLTRTPLPIASTLA